MQESEYGIENLKTLINFIFLTLNKVLTIDANADGKLSFPEILSVVTTLSFQFPDIYESFPFLKKEWRDLDDEEREALRVFVNDELDLPMKLDHIELAVKQTVNALYYNYRYIKNMRALFPKNDPVINLIAAKN